MAVSEDDAFLVARCKRELPHRHDAFEALVDRYKAMVYTLCYRMAGRPSDGEDLMQEVFTKVFLSIETFEERASFSSWVYRIAYNHCLNFIEKRRRTLETVAGYAQEQRLVAARSHFEGDAQKTLDALSPEYRSVLILKYVIGLELIEIGQSLGISVGAVKMRLLRARDEFRRLHTSSAEGVSPHETE